MSAATASATKIAAPQERWDQSTDLFLRFMAELARNPDAYDDMPDSCALALIPVDDPEQASFEIEKGLASVRSGKNVYFRHVVVAELPDLPPPDATKAAGMRRTEFNRDGSVHTVAVLGADGEWHEYEPSPEERAELESGRGEGQ